MLAHTDGVEAAKAFVESVRAEHPDARHLSLIHISRDWNDVIWAITTRMDPARDTVLVENTPIDYLDLSNPCAIETRFCTLTAAISGSVP